MGKNWDGGSLVAGWINKTEEKLRKTLQSLTFTLYYWYLYSCPYEK